MSKKAVSWPVNLVYVEIWDANVDVDAKVDVDDLDQGELVVMIADGKVPLKICDSKVPDDQVVYVHDVLLTVFSLR